MEKALWGIDLGGTKIEGVILQSKANPQVISRMRIPTEAGNGYNHIIGQIQKLIAMLSEDSGLVPHQIGFGTPGTLDPITQKIKNSNTVCLNGMAFKQDLENVLQVPVILANDANCFALAETHMGIVKEAFPEAQVVFGVILGTGVGGGIVISGQIVGGRQGIGGEWGHNYLDESGGKCYCGKTGCVETVIAGSSLERYYHAISNNRIRLPEIVKRYKDQNDTFAEETIQRLLEKFGQAISVVINILDPDVVVLGGGVGNIDLLYIEGVKEVRKNVFNNRLDTIFLRPKLGDSAGVFGAAMLTC